MLWTCAGINDYVCPQCHRRQRHCICNRSKQNTAVAVKAGGRGDVTSSHQLWVAKKGSNVSSPVFYKDHLYWSHEGRGIVYCANAKTGEIVYEERSLPSPTGSTPRLLSPATRSTTSAAPRCLRRRRRPSSFWLITNPSIKASSTPAPPWSTANCSSGPTRLFTAWGRNSRHVPRPPSCRNLWGKFGTALSPSHFQGDCHDPFYSSSHLTAPRSANTPCPQSSSIARRTKAEIHISLVHRPLEATYAEIQLFDDSLDQDIRRQKRRT